jgi:hypothetical protein
MVDMDMPRGSESLWPIVHRVVGPSEAVRRRRVEEDEFVRLFAWAGVDQISEGLGQPLVEGLGDEDLASKEPSGRIRSLMAAERIVDRINDDRKCERRVTRNMLRERWRLHSEFVADVLSFAVYRRHWSLRTLTTEEVHALTADPDFAAAISRVAHENLAQARQSAERRLHFLAVAYAESDPVVRQALGETYDMINKQWTEVYSQVLRSRGLRLRDGVTLEQVTTILTAIDDGLTMRMLTDPSTSVLGDRPEDNLLGLMVRLLIAGCVDPGDNRSVDSAVNSLSTAGSVIPS